MFSSRASRRVVPAEPSFGELFDGVEPSRGQAVCRRLGEGYVAYPVRERGRPHRRQAADRVHEVLFDAPGAALMGGDVDRRQSTIPAATERQDFAIGQEGTFIAGEDALSARDKTAGRAPWKGEAGTVAVELVAVDLPDGCKRTTVTGTQAPPADQQTIRPDAELLFVAGAGWTKTQADRKAHPEEAAELIREFLRQSQASLGGASCW